MQYWQADAMDVTDAMPKVGQLWLALLSATFSEQSSVRAHGEWPIGLLFGRRQSLFELLNQPVRFDCAAQAHHGLLWRLGKQGRGTFQNAWAALRPFQRLHRLLTVQALRVERTAGVLVYITAPARGQGGSQSDGADPASMGHE